MLNFIKLWYKLEASCPAFGKEMYSAADISLSPTIRKGPYSSNVKSDY
jgi:hypothetical protein